MMHSNFSKPQRQSVKGIAILFADTLQKLIRGLWAPLLLVLFKMKPNQYWIVLLSIVFVFLIVGVVAYLIYINFTFYLDDKKREFVINKGVLNKSILTIPLDKIQQININQTVVQKLVSTYSLDIDTAGSNAKEASIRAIDESLALLLKEKLLEQSAVKDIQDEEVTSSITNKKPFFKLSVMTLLKVGLFSNYGRSIAILIGFFAAFYNGIADLSQTFNINDEEVKSYVVSSFEMFSIAILMVVIFVVILMINLVRTFIKFFDFEITKQKDALAISSGLFAKKNTLVKPSKVQITSFSQNFFQRKLHFFNLKLKQASSSDESSKESKKAAIEIPGCDPTEKELILATILKTVSKNEVYDDLQPNIRYIIKSVILTLIIPMGFFLFFSFFVNQELKVFYPLILPYFLIFTLLIYFGYKNYQLSISEGFIIKRSGAWDVEYEIIKTYKIQAITMKQYFWHKNKNIGHLTLHTAAGDIDFKFGNFAVIKNAINYWLFQVETAEKKWM